MSAAGTTVAHNLAPVMTTNKAKCIKLKTKLQLRIFVDQCNIFMHNGATTTSHKGKVVNTNTETAIIDFPVIHDSFRGK